MNIVDLINSLLSQIQWRFESVREISSGFASYMVKLCAVIQLICKMSAGKFAHKYEYYVSEVQL
jgi:hypothetical protein